MKRLYEYIIERGPAPKVELSKKEIVLLDTYNNREDEDLDITIEDFESELESVNKEYDGYIITGTLGLWNGKKDIFPEYFQNIEDAYHKCVEKSDDVIVKLVDGALEVNAMHHDGTNTLYIRPLSNKGDEIFYSFTQGYEDDYFNNIDDDTFVKKFLKDNAMVLKFKIEDFEI
jgi:hypothetical protein